MPNHYDMLGVATTASPAEVKKSFYKLSKTYHPDLHPNDPDASQKFLKIGEAYGVLGSEEKRARYDKDFLRVRQQPGRSQDYTPRGSYSSSGPGGRSPSGLSRRRTQFKGPPPSFYRSGGWGDQSAKRSEHASKASHTHEAQGQAASGPAGPGMGPGGFSSGFDHDVPHFDQRAHHQTHSGIERTRHRARRKAERQYAETAVGGGGSSMLLNFIIVTGLLGLTSAAAGVVGSSGKVTPKTRDVES